MKICCLRWEHCMIRLETVENHRMYCPMPSANFVVKTPVEIATAKIIEVAVSLAVNSLPIIRNSLKKQKPCTKLSILCSQRRQQIFGKFGFMRITFVWEAIKFSNFVGIYLHPFSTSTEVYVTLLVNHKNVWFLKMSWLAKNVRLNSGEFLGVKMRQNHKNRLGFQRVKNKFSSRLQTWVSAGPPTGRQAAVLSQWVPGHLEGLEEGDFGAPPLNTLTCLSSVTISRRGLGPTLFSMPYPPSGE